MSEAMIDLSQLLAQYRLAVLCESPESERIAERIREEALRQAEERMARQREEASGWRGLLQQVQDYGRHGVALESQPLQELLSGGGVQAADAILQQAIRELHQRGLKDYVPVVDPPKMAVEPPQPVPSVKKEPEPDLDLLGLQDAFANNAFNQAKSDAEQTMTKLSMEEEIKPLREKILKYRTWTNDAGLMRELQQAQKQIASLDEEEGQKVQKLLEQGVQLNALMQKAYNVGLSGGKALPHELLAKAANLGAMPVDIQQMHYKFKKGKTKAAIILTDKAAKAQPAAQTPPFPAFPHDQPHPFALGNLTPAHSWDIAIDETGSIFDQSIFGQNVKAKNKGKLVALLVPHNHPLPKRTSFIHAAETPAAQICDLMRTLLEKGRGCGILGVTLEAMPQVDIDYWDAGFERLVDLILRMLPMDGNPVTLNFLVENRGEYSEEALRTNSAILQRTLESCSYRFAKSFPSQARLLNLNVKVENKRNTSNQTFIAYNGYVDALACAWYGGRPELKEALQQADLLHRCLLDGDSQELPLVMDRLEHHESVPMRTWNSLLLSPDAAMGDSLVSRLLERQGQLLRQDVDAWTAFVEEVVGHLNSKAISLRLLSRQIDWLAANMPDESQLPGRLRLVWLTSKLAEENHRGRLSPELIGDITMLSRQLFIEDAPLCCWANLHAAVESTNAFRFGEARQTVLDYARQAELFSGAATPLEAIRQGIPSHKVAIQGLQYYGQLLSSLGQHEAFLGNSAGALPYLDAALQCYAQMDDHAKSRLDISQTLSYKVICLMDSAADKLSIQKQMEQYLGASLTDSAVKLAVARDDSSKYAHHILLRYLVELPTSHPAVQAYLARQDKWQVGNGHPWELIEFYRALLLENAQQRLAHLDQAAELALRDDSGATLKAIAAVIIRARLGLEDHTDWHERLNGLLETLVLELPDFGPTRLELLSAKNGQTLPPLELARRVLPFNFR